MCKIQNENELNETIKCECFGLNSFEGEKCETKTVKMVFQESTVKTTSIIAIIILISFISLTILSDIHSSYFEKYKPKNKDNKKAISKRSNSSADQSITNDSETEEDEDEEEKPKDKYLSGKCLLQFKK